MAKTSKSKSDSKPARSSKNTRAEIAQPIHLGSEKVGSSRAAAEHFGGSGDFGIPADQAQPGQQTIVDGSMESRPLGTRMPPATPDGIRTSGVGAPNSGPGSGSGGDLDPDIIGIGTGKGLAASPKTRTQGPDIIKSVNDDKTFGPPSKGENQLPAGTHGVVAPIRGTVHDRMDRDVRVGKAGDAAAVDESSGGIDRATGDDIDDRQAATGAD
jgi:hypothetical protein